MSAAAALAIIEPSIIHQGTMYKRISGWRRVLGTKYRKRYWVLFDNGSIEYYRLTKRSRQLRGTAQLTANGYCYHSSFLRDVFGDCPKRVENACCFSLITSTRNFHLFTQTEDERVDWMQAIEGVIIGLQRKFNDAEC
eukprot:m.7461 g.7461  ORF g.7461 m.7461 type:complete len:138 (+) comp18721_c0_seq1:7-420(+)